MGQTARIFDVVGRFAGDEFLGVISNVDREQLVAVGERFRVMVAASSLWVGSYLTAYIIGGILNVTAILVTVFDFCIPSLIYNFISVSKNK